MEKVKKEKKDGIVKQSIYGAIGIVTLILAYALWVYDRLISALLPTIELKSFVKWVRSMDDVVYSAIRVSILTMIPLIIYFIYGLF